MDMEQKRYSAPCLDDFLLHNNLESISEKIQKNIVLVGDAESGKTFLFNIYAEKAPPQRYTPTVCDTCIVETTIDCKHYQLVLTDTAGYEAYDRLRPLSYTDADILVLCYAVDQPQSFNNLKDKWILEILHFCPDVPVLLVCTKVDLREDETVVAKLARINQRPVTHEEGRRLSKDIGATGFVECSALLGCNVVEVVYTAVRTTLDKKVNDKNLKKMKQIHHKRRSCMF